MGVAGKLLKAELIMRGLARFAEADLVDGDHTVTGCCQCRDGALPGGGAEILAVKQHHRLAVRRAGGFHVHKGHAQLFALRGQGVVGHRPRIFEALELRPVGRLLIGGLRRRRSGDRASEPQAQTQCQNERGSVHYAILSQQHLTEQSTTGLQTARPAPFWGDARPHVFGDLMREIGPAIDPHSDKI